MSVFTDISRVLPREAVITTEKGSFAAEPALTMTADDVSVVCDNGKITLRAENSAVKYIEFVYDASFSRGTRFLGDAWERSYGELEWRGFVFDRTMPWYFFAKSGDALFGCGVKTCPDAICSFYADRNSITLKIDVTCGADGVVLGGSAITCCELVCREYEGGNLFDNQCDFVRALSTGAVLPEKKVYGFNNWYYAYGNSDREQILGNAKQLSALTEGLENRPYLVIDDGWQKLRCSEYIGGPWREANSRHGDMKTLADEIASLGLIPGIWYRPLNNRDEALTDEMFACKRDDILDPSREDVLAFIRDDIETLCSWGYRLIKYDYSTNDITRRWGNDMNGSFCDGSVHFYDRSKTNAMIIKNLYKTIFDASKGRALILGCNCVGHLGTGYMHLNRTGDDTSGRSFGPTRHNGVNCLAFRMPQHNAFFAVDADCVGLTDRVPWKKNFLWLKMLALSGTPLFVSVPADLLNDEQNEVLRHYLEIASKKTDVAVPLDVLETSTPEIWLTDGEQTEYPL